MIWALKGRYRLVKDQLFLTIVYRTVTEGGHIEISGSSEDFNNFDLVGGMMKDIREPVIKELPDPLYISVKEPGHIEIGNEDYFKISKKDMQAIEPGLPDSTALPALDYDSIQTLVARIDREVNGIDADSATRRVVRDKKLNFRGDPTEVTKYFKGDSLCKMVTVSAGRSLPRTTIYYFREGTPLFVKEIEKRDRYTDESRYYFQGPHLIKAVIDGHSDESRDFPRLEEFFQKELKRMQ